MHDPGGVSFAGGANRERAFGRAARHSRLVRICRRAIPVALLLVLGGVVANAYLKPLQILAKLPLDRFVLSGSKINMEAPHIAGFTRDNRPYDLTARTAAQDIANPGVLELSDVLAHITLQDHSLMEVRAKNGVYDTKADVMELKTNVVLTTSNGYIVHLDEAKVDNKAGRVISDHPVAVTMTNGTIDARALEVVENGDLIRFTNGVETHMVPQSAAGTTNAAPANAVPANVAPANAAPAVAKPKPIKPAPIARK
jgi:lipopolysaccharide export system protein LptC